MQERFHSMLSRFGVVCALAIAGPHPPSAAQGLNDSREFASAAIDSLTSVQVANLVTLGKVWGFAKYHDFAVTRGEFDWDAELLRVVPAVLEAPDRTTANGVLADWLERIGSPVPCSPHGRSCASTAEKAHLRSPIEWIHDEQQLGRELSELLAHLYDNRDTRNAQHYVSLTPGVGNPRFTNEKEYADNPLPNADVRLLALYRFWNIIEYWYPNRDLLRGEWDGVLRDFIPRLYAAGDSIAYRLAIITLIARVQDTHANLWSHLQVRPPRGSHALPVVLRFVEGRAVVTEFSHKVLGPESGLRVGDVITSIDGARVDSLIDAWAPFYAASNQPTRLRDMARNLTLGHAGRVELTVERDGAALRLQPERIALDILDRRAGSTHDLPGETFQLLSKDVAYVKLSSVLQKDASDYIERAAGTKVLVVDLRNYPSQFMVFAMGSHLVSQTTGFVRFTFPVVESPGSFVMSPVLTLRPARPRYTGKVVILVDETTQSQAEYTAMAFRSAPNSLVVGSTTAGADGNVSPIILPGGLRTAISGIGVFYPDGTPTQRVGIVPDLVVLPTIEGIRQGRDEVLEAAVSRALGREFRLDR